MQFYKHLYVQEGISEKKLNIIKKKLEEEKVQPFIHLVTLASNPKNLLEIIPSYLLLQPDYPKENLIVVGIAKGNEEAMELVKTIVEEVYQETGNTNVRAYIMEKNQ